MSTDEKNSRTFEGPSDQSSPDQYDQFEQEEAEHTSIDSETSRAFESPSDRTPDQYEVPSDQAPDQYDPTKNQAKGDMSIVVESSRAFEVPSDQALDQYDQTKNRAGREIRSIGVETLTTFEIPSDQAPDQYDQTENKAGVDMSIGFELSTPFKVPSDQASDQYYDQIEHQAADGDTSIGVEMSRTFEVPSDQNDQIGNRATWDQDMSIDVERLSRNLGGQSDQAPDQNDQSQVGGEPLNDPRPRSPRRHRRPRPPQRPRPPIVELQTSKRWSIVRVPAHVREVDEKAYKPKLLYIGPFHLNEPILKPMESQKLRFVTRLQGKLGRQNLLGDLESHMKNLETETRECYSEDFEHSSDSFVRMLVVDALFIVEFLRLYEKGSQEIYSLTHMSNNPAPFENLALKFFSTLMLLPENFPSEVTNATTQESEPHHLLDLFQRSFISRRVERSSSQNSTRNRGDNLRATDIHELPRRGWVKNAKMLDLAGIRLCARQGGDDLLAIKFRRRVLAIPTLTLDDDTVHLLRNLIAYEQSSTCVKPLVTCLAIFLDSIVETPDDIILLRDKGIIKHDKGSNDEILDLLKSLSREIEFDTKYCYLIKQIEDINKFCDSLGAKFRRSAMFFSKNVTPRLVQSFILTYISLVQTLLYKSRSSALQTVLAPGPTPSG
ncbi:hypothetical protein TorRG33x02_272440 [Trema orientale]|uniref:Uncharacterized protein n=1 Tax=Trema orientale TaxID=63057 RepID=A0A2P5CUW5_TREOI|nr:hypothetical protein TorRG33x02_272440 [Trema orientale]